MISRLMESRLEFVAVDFPHANRFTIHILAAVAEYESRLSSERMTNARISAVESRQSIPCAMTNRHNPIRVQTVGYIERKSQ